MRWLALGSIVFSLLFFSLYLPFSRAATARYPDPGPARRLLRALLRPVERRGLPAVALRQQPAAGSLRRADGDARPARPVRRGVRLPDDRGELRGAGRLPVRAGRLDARRCGERVGGGQQHGPARPPRPDARVPLRWPDAGGDRPRRGLRARRRAPVADGPVRGGLRVRGARDGGDAGRATRVSTGARSGAPGGATERVRSRSRERGPLRAGAWRLFGCRGRGRGARGPGSERPPTVGAHAGRPGRTRCEERARSCARRRGCRCPATAMAR